MYRKNGFYSVYLEKFNLKIISLNTQAGNDDNWFLLRDPTDPGGQLEWMEAELR
jgi:sphingomyelin phosphodiesterase